MHGSKHLPNINNCTNPSLATPGEDADRKFLRKLSLRNDGFMRHIYEAADAALQLHDFYKQVSSPLLADVKFIYPENQVNCLLLTDLKKKKIRNSGFFNIFFLIWWKARFYNTSDKTTKK